MTDKGPLNIAAQYLRMSTEHQQYSLANQSDAIRIYADANGLRIEQTYSDAGKSGLVLKRRDGLRQLLNDVMSGTAKLCGCDSTRRTFPSTTSGGRPSGSDIHVPMYGTPKWTQMDPQPYFARMQLHSPHCSPQSRKR